MSSDMSSNQDYKLEAGIASACIGLLKDCSAPWVLEAATQAEWIIGQDYAMNEAAQQNRRLLVRMVKLNLINRNEYEREFLNRRFGLQITKDTLTAERRKFCYEFARLLRFI